MLETVFECDRRGSARRAGLVLVFSPSAVLIRSTGGEQTCGTRRMSFSAVSFGFLSAGSSVVLCFIVEGIGRCEQAVCQLVVVVMFRVIREAKQF